MHLQVFLVPREGGCELVRLGREFGLVEAERLDELGVRVLDAVVDVGEERYVEVLHPNLGDVLELRRESVIYYFRRVGNHIH